jgi:protein involved in polysaccharide export with SLBB domain
MSPLQSLISAAFLFLFLLARPCVYGQTLDDLGAVKVEELTDDQIRRFVVEADRLGMKDEQIEDIALQRGMSPVEVVKLKDRVQAMRKAMGAGNNAPPPAAPSPAGRKMDSASALEQRPLMDFNTVFGSLKMRNFGAGVFSNPRISFEPNMRIPTPKNYQLATDDELLIDVSGYSEASYRLKVSPEGRIRIPVAGAVMVNGLTIEQAKRAIVQKLAATIYSDIRNGKTSVDVTLGSIRSIRVTIIGEATVPGAYTLPSLASAYNALYACGGPNGNGSYRNIQVIRNNAVVSTIDIYQYLTSGAKQHDIRLMDQDVIRISTYGVRVELKGEVKKPGLYDVVKASRWAR